MYGSLSEKREFGAHHLPLAFYCTNEPFVTIKLSCICLAAAAEGMLLKVCFPHLLVVSLILYTITYPVPAEVSPMVQIAIYIYIIVIISIGDEEEAMQRSPFFMILSHWAYY